LNNLSSDKNIYFLKKNKQMLLSPFPYWITLVPIGMFLISELGLYIFFWMVPGYPIYVIWAFLFCYAFVLGTIPYIIIYFYYKKWNFLQRRIKSRLGRLNLIKTIFKKSYVKV
jgi:hypothetical protein